MNQHTLSQRLASSLRLCAAAVSLVAVAGVPAYAQVDLSGTWGNRVYEDFIERAPGPSIGDYLGLPLNDEARARADAWQISVQTMPERQCILYTTQYLVMGPQNLRIVSETDPLSGQIVALRLSGTVDRPPHTIWLDGRPHPSKYAIHTSAGFTTGVWEGQTLVAQTTHLKEGMIWRNGVPHSDQATINEFYTRHGNTLTITMMVDDPVYLDEPFVRSASFQLDPNVRVLPEPCEPQVEIERPEGEVPHYLPGTNPFLGEMTRLYNIPFEAVRGGAAAMYPEYRKTLKDKYVAPAMCLRNCCGGAPGLNCDVPATPNPPAAPAPTKP
jgi:hypothetical protein